MIKQPTPTFKPTTKAALGILALIAMVVYAPFGTIWMINQLTNIHVEYTIWTWLAAQWLHIIVYFFRSNTSTTTTAFVATPTNKNES